ncbi:hypothetical protein Csa_015649 [Cucumis sativus]|uniref:Uncharacterized protein n=1 Tax=Cucumis sativus TaxID=3659 RepID=A0A0A0K4E5_CUCSA|nr:hypothetical protein Csa_015649 [Cucumis sativus]
MLQTAKLKVARLARASARVLRLTAHIRLTQERLGAHSSRTAYTELACVRLTQKWLGCARLAYGLREAGSVKGKMARLLEKVARTEDSHDRLKLVIRARLGCVRRETFGSDEWRRPKTSDGEERGADDWRKLDGTGSRW